MSAEIRTGLDVRLHCRDGTFRTHTSGTAKGYLQANIIVIPSRLAKDFKQFCELNYGPLPLLHTSEPGEAVAPPLAEDSEIRSDLAVYQTFVRGEVTECPTSLVKYPWDGMVTFYLGCSYSFEENLTDAGLSIRNVAEKKMVSVFVSSIVCQPSFNGSFTCSMYCSMRPIKVKDLKRVIVITGKTPSAHGSPMHIGDPSRIGVKDVLKCDFGDNTTFENDEVPVFWGCGLTSVAALKTAAPEIGFTQAPGYMFVSDVSVSEWDKDVQVPDILLEEILPGFYSYISTEIAAKIQTLQRTMLSDDTPEGSLLRALMILSHSSKVIVLVPSQPQSSDVLRCLSLVSTLSAFNVKTTLLTPDEEACVALRKCFDVRNPCCVASNVQIIQAASSDAKESYDTCINFTQSAVPANLRTDCLIKIDNSDSKLTKDSLEAGKQAAINIEFVSKDKGGSEHILSAGLFCAMQCPMHWRYRQHAIGDRKAQAAFEGCLPMDEQILAEVLSPLKSGDDGDSMTEYLKIVQSLEQFCFNFGTHFNVYCSTAIELG